MNTVEDSHGRRLTGAVLMLLGVVLCAVSVLVPWNHGFGYTVNDAGDLIAEEDQAWNAFDVVSLTLEDHGPTGELLMAALILALLAAVVVLALAVAALVGSRIPTGLVVAAAVLGTVATVGTLIGYFVLGFGHEAGLGVWLFGFSFVPVLVGAVIAVTGRR